MITQRNPLPTFQSEGPAQINNDTLAYIGIGSNVGDRISQIRAALLRLQEDGAGKIVAVSSLYETEPVGWDGGPWYLNAVAGILAAKPARALLDALRAVEQKAGRIHTLPNAPRPLDLDLLLYGREQHCDADLIVPHPRMCERAFVLWPLAEIAPDIFVSPGTTARQAVLALTRHEAIRKVSDPMEVQNHATVSI